ESDDGFEAIVLPFIAVGAATLIDHPGKGVQHAVYSHCLHAFSHRTRWLMFCDDDEFLFPVDDISLPQALERYEEFAGVAVSWMLYGSSGHWTRPRGLVIENYAMRSAAPDQHVKCIVNPGRIVRPIVVGHHFECVAGHVIVDENGEPMNGPLHSRPSANLLRINHYLTKSRAEMIERRQSIQVNTGKVSPLSVDQWCALEATWNQVRDPIAARYGDRVRHCLSSRSSSGFPATPGVPPAFHRSERTPALPG
ncbi:MAG: glycosyltransferase family 92 protein, partial [Opitutaceae bacterium]